MKLFVRAFFLAAFAVFTATGTPADPVNTPAFSNIQNDPLYDQETYQRIRDITVDVSWNQKDLGSVMRDLTLSVRSANPIRASINFRISSDAPPDFKQQRVSLTMRGVPIYQALEILSGQVPFTIKVHREVVLIIPTGK